MADGDAYWSAGQPQAADTEAYWKAGQVNPPTIAEAVAAKPSGGSVIPQMMSQTMRML